MEVFFRDKHALWRLNWSPKLNPSNQNVWIRSDQRLAIQKILVSCDLSDKNLFDNNAKLVQKCVLEIKLMENSRLTDLIIVIFLPPSDTRVTLQALESKVLLQQVDSLKLQAWNLDFSDDVA